MGRIRDEIYDSMWDPVSCDKHSWTGPDSRFHCPYCEKEVEESFNEKRDRAKEILKPYGLSDMVKYSRY